MKEIIFATGNKNKVSEVERLLKGKFNIKSLADIGFFDEIPETQPTLEGNALQKARFVYEKFGKNCFSEDTGLEIDALNGEPGVFSARYAGEDKNSEANMMLVLKKMSNFVERSARFRTVIALILDGEEFLFEGIAEGKIAQEKTGSSGFGYDPIFIPENFTKSFAEMTAEEKNMISHRGKAVVKLVDFLFQK